jgi:hypothetical protein
VQRSFEHAVRGINRRGSAGFRTTTHERPLRHPGHPAQRPYAAHELHLEPRDRRTERHLQQFRQPVQPRLHRRVQSDVDYGNADFDNRHRIALSAIYEIPFARHMHGARQAFWTDGSSRPSSRRARALRTPSTTSPTTTIYTRVAATRSIPVSGNLPAGRRKGPTRSAFSISARSVDESYSTRSRAMRISVRGRPFHRPQLFPTLREPGPRLGHVQEHQDHGARHLAASPGSVQCVNHANFVSIPARRTSRAARD